MKKQYRYWHLPLMAFYSRRLYHDVATRWKGSSLGWICLLLAVCLIPAARNAGQLAGRMIDEKSEVFLMQVPPMQVIDGELTVDAPQPYSIIEGDRTVLLIDTTGRIASLDESGAMAFLDKTHLYIRQPDGPPIVKPLSEFEDMEIDRQIASEFVQLSKEVFTFAYYALVYVVSLVFTLLLVLLLGLVARLLAGMQHRKLSYMGGLRISAVALTPPLILSAVIGLFDWSPPAFLYLLVGLVYLYFAAGCAEAKDPGKLPR